ncbi:hypothetical protein K469DRAFT_696047 [Zopfia rhizophila CBS 207.26]|uniref:Uncharacterized protein n=1 Tax=Zopfia rhizophila CBS 207.26 TaxID=1314779 RepID=A0A6A6EMH7_9PEZI|nr:hypothetical protein K469DRAFT_696047 [Zopfia rhizophila CBS 207.26]
MSKVPTLHMDLPEFHTDPFAAAFETGNLQTPSIKTLVLGPYCGFMVRHWPNVDTILSNGWSSSTPSGGEKPVTRATAQRWISSTQWPKHYISALRNTPMVALRASLGSPQGHAASQEIRMLGGCYDDGINMFVWTITKFAQMEKLVAGRLSGLRVGFTPPWCGNAYMEPGGEGLWRQVDKEHREANKQVAQMIFGVNSNLSILWVGNYFREEVERDEMSKGVVGWTWYGNRRKSPPGRTGYNSG